VFCLVSVATFSCLFHPKTKFVNHAAMIGPLAIQTEADGPFYAVAGAWFASSPSPEAPITHLFFRCFITNEYKDTRIYVHYLPVSFG
jgi:hypothetical protein